jgi:Zn-dependent protease
MSMERAPHFSLAGIPVRVEPLFFVVIAILGVDPRQPDPALIASWVAIAFASVLLHELGHAIAFRAFGVSPRVTLHGLGGLTSGSGELSPLRHIVVSLAGPLSAMVLFGLPALWLDRSGLVSGDLAVIVGQAVWINIGWSLVNLVPVLPLDGGQVVSAVVDLATGGRGRRVAEWISIVVAAALGMWALAAGFVVGLLLAAVFVGLNISALSRSRHEDVADQLADAQRALLAGRPGDAEATVRAALARRPKAASLAWARELLGWSLLWQGDVAGAGAAARAHGGAPSASFRGALALGAGRTDEGVATLAWALVHDTNRLAISLGVVAAAWSGCSAAVAREVLLLGPEGVARAEVLRQLLAHAGYRDEAAEVARILLVP